MTNTTPPTGGFDPHSGGFDSKYGTTPFGTTPPQVGGGMPGRGQAKFGKIGTILAVVATVIGALQGLLVTMFVQAGAGTAPSWFMMYSLIMIVIAAVVLMFGFMGMRQDTDRLYAGIAIGYGALTLLGYLLSFVFNAVFGLFY